MRRINPFSNTLEISGRSLTNRPDIRIEYKVLPPGMSAGYVFEDKPKIPIATIFLPKIDVTKFNEEQKTKWFALLVHEMLHHDRSEKNSVDKAMKDSKFIKNLHNCLEDARVEIDNEQRWISIGAFEDLFKYRMTKLHEMEREANTSMLNPWGWLFQAFKYSLPNYGMIPIPPEMKDYFKIGMEILNKDDRFKKAYDKGRSGCVDVLDLAIEMAEAWQQRRDKDFEEEDKEFSKNKGENDDETDSGIPGESPVRDNADCDNNPDDDNNGDGKGDAGSKDVHDIPDEDNNKSGERSGEDEDGKSNDGKHQNDNGKPLGGNKTDGEDPPENSNTPSENSSEKSDIPSPNGDRTDIPSEGEDKTEERNPKDGPSGESSEIPNEPDEDSLDPPKDRPQNIKEEYENDQAGDNSMEPDTLGLEVAALAPDEGSWERTEEVEDIGDGYRETPDWSGDSYIPYTHEDREIVPKEDSAAYARISTDVNQKVQNLRRTLTKILTIQTQTFVDRGYRKGDLDSHLYYKITKGSRRVKSRTIEGKNLDTAVTLLLDLSGSMKGAKAQLAVRIGSLFGEALNPVPKTVFEILGYNSSPLSSKQNNLDLMKSGYTRMEIINYWIFKTFNEPWNTTRNRLGACTKTFSDTHPENGGACDGCNVDHENVLHAARRLWDRKEKNKIMMVICDGAPSGYNGSYGGLLDIKLKESVQRVKKAGIKVFCFGIQSPRVAHYYSPDFQLVNSLDDLDEKTLRKLGSYLLQG